MDNPKKKWFSVVAVLLAVVTIASGCGGGGEGAESPEETASPEAAGGWSLTPINITEDGGVLRVELAARNDSDDWSAMRPAAEGESVSLVAGGETYACETVRVDSGGHYLPPGFQIRGYLNKEGEVQNLLAECTAPEGSLSDAHLSVPYIYATGDYDYYEKGENVHEAQIDVEIDPEQAPPDLTYPVASSLEVEPRSPSEPIEALNDCTLELAEVTRNDEGFSFTWTVTNPGEYNTIVHIGRPPAVGENGIVYGYWVSPDIVEVPMAKAGETVEIETQSAVPQVVETPYLLLSVEQKRERLFTHYLLDLSEVE